MEIWLETADLQIIEEAKETGILYGVMTNPSLIAESPLGVEELLEKILAMQSGPLAVQVTGTEAAKMVEQGEAIHRFSNRLVVQIPVTGAGLKAMCSLTQKQIPVMASAVFDSSQVLLAAKAGAHYIAPHFSTICDLDATGIEEFYEMFKLLRRYQFGSKLLGSSFKSSEQVKQCSAMGIDAVALDGEVFLSFIAEHEETTKKLAHYAKDWALAKKSTSLSL